MFNFSDRFQELRSSIIGLVLLLASMIIGVVWISIGISNCLTNYLGSTWGPIVMGLICFVPTLCFALVKTFGSNAPSQPVATYSEHAESAVSNLAKVFEELPKNSSVLIAGAAVAAAFIANRFPALLPIFTEVLSSYAHDVKAKAAQEVTEKAETY